MERKALLLYAMMFFSTYIRAEVDLKGSIHENLYLDPSGTFSLDISEKGSLRNLKEHVSENGYQIDFADKDGNNFEVMVVLVGSEVPSDFVDGIILRGKEAGKNAEKGETPEGDPCLIYRQLLKEDQSDEGFGRMNVVFSRNKTVFDIVMNTRGFGNPNEASEALSRGFTDFWRKAGFRGVYVDYPPLAHSIDPLVAKVVDLSKQLAIEKGYGFDLSLKNKAIVHFTAEANSKIEVAIGVVRRGPKVVFSQLVSYRGDDYKQGEKMKKSVITAFKKKLSKEGISYIEDNSMDGDLMPVIQKISSRETRETTK